MKTTIRLFSGLGLAALLVSVGACQTQKSSNPLTPTIAGPIPGVMISPPTLISPAQGTKLKESQQPVRLVIGNSTTSGVRPLKYTFEVAADNGFATKLFSRSGVPPGDNGQTSVQLDPLAIGRSYFWRARAEDGANTGDFATAGFDIYPKAVLNPPAPVAPVNNVVSGSTSPDITVLDSNRAGPIGDVQYEFHVSLDQAFTQVVAQAIVGETPGQTTYTPPALTANKTYYWRVRASDGETTSGWATTQVFKTPAAPGPGPGPGPGPVPGDWASCGKYTDHLQLVQCVHAAIKPTNGATAFEVTKRVAWLLRGEGAGELIKNGGENIISWQGYSFSISRICYPDGHIYKVITDAGDGGTNGPGWADNGFVDKSLYVAAIDPNK
jgi:hypothetical protein